MHRAASEARRQAKALKALMFGLTAAGGDSGARAADAMRTAREAVFVITDMESSTAQAAASAAGASSVQAIYDTARAASRAAPAPPPRSKRAPRAVLPSPGSVARRAAPARGQAVPESALATTGRAESAGSSESHLEARASQRSAGVARTAAAATSAGAVRAQVMREGIAAHGGYEINTEGDAFHIAFTTVAQAVAFAMEAQARPGALHGA
jgi:hypothetical protein